MPENNNIKPSEVSEVLLQQLKGIDTSLKFDEVGTVLQVSDGEICRQDNCLITSLRKICLYQGLAMR